MQTIGCAKLSWRCNAGLALALAALDWICITVSGDSSHVPLLQPLCGIGAGLCLTTPAQDRKKILAVTCAASLLARLVAYGSISVSFLPAIVTAASVCLTCGVARRLLGEHINFRNWKQILGFCAICAALSISFGVIYAGWMASRSDHGILSTWATWSLCTSLSYAVFAPAFVIFRTMGRAALAKHRDKLIMSAAIMAVVLVAIFAQPSVTLYYLIPLAVNVVIFVAELEGAALALALASTVTLVLTATLHGLIIQVPWSEPEQLLWVEAFLALQTLILLPTAAAITEHRDLKRDSAAARLESHRTIKTRRHIARRW